MLGNIIQVGKSSVIFGEKEFIYFYFEESKLSRIGKIPIKVPDNVEIEIKDNVVKVSKDGKILEQRIHPKIEIDFNKDNRLLTVRKPLDNKFFRSMHGLYRTLINNMLIGVTSGFEKRLQIVGIGYRAEAKGRFLQLQLGFSHPVLFIPPEGIEIKVENPTSIVVSGFDKQLVGLVADKIRSFKPPEPYKGKGIRYINEYVRRKAGKAAGK